MGSVIKNIFNPSTIINGIIGFMTGGPIGAAIAIAGSAYQQAQYEKAQKAQQRQIEQLQEEQKGFQFATEGEPISLPIAYGRVKMGGVRTSFKTDGDYTHSSDGDQSFKNGLTAGVTGTKNEFLYFQQAICQGGIEGVVDIDVNNLGYDDEYYDYGLRIDVDKDGGNAMALATDNGFASTNTFDECAYATCVFRLDRDDVQYSGPPEVQFYLKGMKVSQIATDGTKSAKAFSQNPALILYDYLTEDYGLGLADTDLDMASFGLAASICDTSLQTSVDWYGKVNNDNSTTLKLYECNLIIDRSKDIRTNIQQILRTMGQADLIWSDGKYKLQLEYPDSSTDVTNAVVATFTDDEIVRSRNGLSIAYVAAQNKFNQATINFTNSHEEFKTDTITWPETGSTQHNTYLTADNNLPLSTEITVPGVTDPYHARHRVWQAVVESRDSRVYTFTVDSTGFILEPGDFIRINSELNDTDVYAKVTEVKLTDDGTIDITAKEFFYQNNVSPFTTNFAAPVLRTAADFTVAPPTGLSFTSSTTSTYTSDPSGVLSWTASDDVAVSRYGVYASGIYADKEFLGYTANTFMELPSLSINPLLGLGATTVDFEVFAETPTGRRSSIVTLANQTIDPTDSTGLTYSAPTASDNLNETSGSLSWTNADTRIDRFIVQYRVNGDTAWITLGTTDEKAFDLPVLKDNNYDFSIYGKTAAGRNTGRTTLNNVTIGVGQVSGITFEGADTAVVSAGSSGRVTWTAPSTATVTRYIVEISVADADAWVTLGDSLVTSFELPSIATGTYDIGVTSVTTSGKKSTRQILEDVSLEPTSAIQNSAVVVIYRRTNTINQVKPSNDVTYKFSPPGIVNDSDLGNNWNFEIPADSDQTYLLVCQQSVASYDSNVALLATNWTDPKLLSANGADGSASRGPARFSYRVGTSLDSSYSDASIDTFFAAATGGLTKINLDQFWLYSSTTATNFTPTEQYVYLYDSDHWERQDEIITGNLLVDGSITTDKIRADEVITTGRNNVRTSGTGARVVMDGLGLVMYDSSDTLRIRLGYIDGV